MIATGSRTAIRLTIVLACHLGVVMGLPGEAAAEERQLFMFVMNQSGVPHTNVCTVWGSGRSAMQ